MGTVAPLATAVWPFIVTATVAPSFQALRSTALAYGARLVNDGTMGVASTSTATTSFTAPTFTPRLATATPTTIPAMPATAIAAAGGEHLAPAPRISERQNLALAPRTSKRAHYEGCVEHRRGGSQFRRLADCVR